MPISYLSYDLNDGYIHHWLVGGPEARKVRAIGFPPCAEAREEILRSFYEEPSGISRLPVEPGPLAESEFTLGSYTGHWTYTACADDHLVDCTAFYPTCHHLRAWAYTQLTSQAAQSVSLILTAYGPADVWVNGVRCCRQEQFGVQHMTFTAALLSGDNEILVRFEQVGVRECSHAMALRVLPAESAPALHVQLPTTIRDIAYRNRLEQVFESAYLDREVFTGNNAIALHWANNQQQVAEDVTVRLQTLSGRIYAESHVTALPGAVSRLVHPSQVPEGPLRITLMPRPELYYEQNLRLRREFLLWGTGQQRYAETPTLDYVERRAEALHHAARQEGDLFGEMAKMALGLWGELDADVISRAVESVRRNEAGCELHLLALLGMLSRWGDAAEFPEALKAPVEAGILAAFCRQFDPDTVWAKSMPESRRIVFYTCELLAGQRYPEGVFATPDDPIDPGRTGKWHCKHGTQLVLDWLHERAAGGFAEWDSSNANAAELAALAHLVDLVENAAVWEMATVVLDKLLLTLAFNSYLGVLGAQGCADALGIQDGWLSATSGVTRLLWGAGADNAHLAGPVSLACMEDYELPPLIPEMATATPDGEWWNCEQHLLANGVKVGKATYRTADYLLSSAQDYRPGGSGTREHIWQATLGPEAVVFTNHPACMGATDAHVPGFWLGNRVLPRVAQWKDVLIALYRLPDDDWMGFTHAYFPLYAFDAHTLREDAQGQMWAFAQKDAGYLALTASTGLALTILGPGAYRELRSSGRRTGWLCMMGCAALEGTFAAFQERVLSLPVAFEDLNVRCTTLRGETLAFGWEGPLLRNGQEQPLATGRHYENPYCAADLCADEMEVKSAQYWMRLKFAPSEDSENTGV